MYGNPVRKPLPSSSYHIIDGGLATQSCRVVQAFKGLLGVHLQELLERRCLPLLKKTIYQTFLPAIRCNHEFLVGFVSFVALISKSNHNNSFLWGTLPLQYHCHTV